MSFMKRIPDLPEPPLPVKIFSKLFLCIIPIAEIAIGVIYLDECPRQHYIPIYLIVMGVFSLSMTLFVCRRCGQRQERQELTQFCTLWNSLSSLFMFCWFITGNVWVYSIYEPNYIRNETDPTNYCHKTAYLFSFWVITLVYIVLGLVLLCAGCFICCSIFLGRADPDDDV